MMPPANKVWSIKSKMWWPRMFRNPVSVTIRPRRQNQEGVYRPQARISGGMCFNY